MLDWPLRELFLWAVERRKIEALEDFRHKQLMYAGGNVSFGGKAPSIPRILKG